MHNPSVFGLPVSRSSAWIFNCYIVETAEGLVVIDAGLPIVARRAIDTIEQHLGRSIVDIQSTQCTHAHPDHVAGVSTVTAGHECGRYLPKRCESYLQGEKPRTFPLVESTVRFLPVWTGQEFSRHALGEFLKYGKSIGFGGPPMISLDFEPTGFVDDGDAMPGAPGWEVIHTPGHTDDSTCFYHRESETLISGDAVVSLDGRAWFNPEYVDVALARESEERLRSLPVRHLLPGHGDPVEATDVWATARSFTTAPSGSGILARCSRRFGKW